MFQKKLYVSGNSYLEVATRIYDGEERIMVTISGPKNELETTCTSAILSDEHAALFCKYLNDAVSRPQKDWPPKGDGDPQRTE
jgi:hypothetical protein